GRRVLQPPQRRMIRRRAGHVGQDRHVGVALAAAVVSTTGDEQKRNQDRASTHCLYLATTVRWRVNGVGRNLPSPEGIPPRAEGPGPCRGPSDARGAGLTTWNTVAVNTA